MQYFIDLMHTKFRWDEGFGHICQHVGTWVDDLSMDEYDDAIERSHVSSFRNEEMEPL